MAIGVFALTFVHMKSGLALFLLSFPAGFGGISVLRGTILREYYDASTFGTMMGVMMGFAAVGGIIGPTLAGWAFDTFGNYRLVWFAFSLLLFLAIVLILKIRPRTSQVGQ